MHPADPSMPDPPAPSAGAPAAVPRTTADEWQVLGTVCDGASVALLIADDRQHCVYLNPAAQQLTGYTLDGLANRPLHEVLHHAHPDASATRDPSTTDPIGRALSRGDRATGQAALVRRDGRLSRVAYTASPIRRPERGIVGTVVELRDLSQAQTTEQHWRRIVDSITDAFVSLDREWRFAYVNRRATDYFGRAPDTLLGQVLWTAMPHTRDSDFERHFRAAVATGKAAEFETRSALTGRWVEVRAYPSDEGLSVYFRDVTERRLAADLLRQREELYRLAVTATNNAVWNLDLLANELRWDQAASTSFDSPPASERLDPQWWKDRIHPDDRDRVVAGVDAAIADPARHVWQDEYRFARADGTYAYVFDRGSVLRDPQTGSAVRMVGAMQDLSDRLQAQAALAASEARFRFLGELGEATREVADPQQVMAIIAQRLGEHLGVSRCAYADVEADEDRFSIRHDYVDGTCASTVGDYQLALFGPRAAADMRGGRTLTIRDVDHELPPDDVGVTTFTAIGIKAIVCCPLIKQGRLRAMMAVHQSTPRNWTADEIGLVEAVVERSWSYIEQARVTGALRHSEAELRQLADAMPQIVWITRADGYHEYFNGRWYEFLGMTHEQTQGDGWAAPLHPDDVERSRERWSESLRTGQPYEIEYRFRRHDGEYRWFLGRALPVRDEAGRIRNWYGTCTEIHDQKLADEAVRRGRDQMELVMRGADVGVWYCPLPFDRLIWDEKVKEHFHLPPDAEVTIETFYERIHPDDRERTRRTIQKSIDDRAPYDIEYRTRSADGTRTNWIRATGRGYYDAAGRPVRFDGVTINVTARAQAELAVRESEARFRNMSDNAPVMIWVTDPDGSCVYLNRQWFTVTGQDESEALGMGWLRMVHPDDMPAAEHAFVTANAQRAPFHTEYRMRRKDGEYLWCIDSAAPRFGPNGEYLGYVGSVTDITDRKRQEEERAALLERERAARAEAERASQLKDEFLATLSHELRTPLNAVMGWTQILMRRRRETDIDHGLSVIDRNARAQAQLIEDLLDMSRIISGNLRIDVQPVDLTKVIAAATEAVTPAAEAREISVQTIVDPNVPAVRGDPARLQQVIWNLLSNAIKFTPKGGKVQVALERVNSHVEVTVADTGAGINAAFLPHVFDRFRQADASTTRRFGGLGLGLAIVKNLVELHGGKVRVSSAGEDKGSTFAIELPAMVVQVDRAAGDAPSQARTIGAAASAVPTLAPDVLAGVSVLVVDDEPDARELIREVLAAHGANVVLARSAAEALDLFARFRPRVMVSDIGMPIEDGYHLIRQVRSRSVEEGGATPAAALTAFARSEDRRRALLAGYQSHVAKPVEPDELVTVVASLAGRTGMNGG